MERFEFDNNKLLGLRVCDEGEAGWTKELAKLQVPARIGLKEGPPSKIRT